MDDDGVVPGWRKVLENAGLQKAAVGDPPPAQLRVTIEANPGKAV